jgi:hypothetical protein
MELLSSLSGIPATPDSSVESAKTLLLLTLLNASNWKGRRTGYRDRQKSATLCSEQIDIDH